jgi:hypothetical protein
VGSDVSKPAVVLAEFYDFVTRTATRPLLTELMEKTDPVALVAVVPSLRSP